MSVTSESFKAKQQILAQMSPQELRVLDYIRQNPQGVMVKEISGLLQCVKSTANSLLSQLCEFNFLVRDREGRYGSYLYFLHPSLRLIEWEWALGDKIGKGITDYSTSESQSNYYLLSYQTSHDHSHQENDYDKTNDESWFFTVKQLIEEGLWYQQEGFTKLKEAEALLKEKRPD